MTAAEAAARGRARRCARWWSASLIGTTIEWYDFFLYGTAAALVFGKLFFPAKRSADRGLAGVPHLLAGLRGAADRRAGVRPLRRPDRPQASLDGEPGADGRRPAWRWACCPPTHQIGVAAPVLLAALRFVQGFAVGGEWGGAVLMAGEFGDDKRRGAWSGWPQVGVPAGNLLAAGVLAVMAALQSEADFLAWGWRVRVPALRPAGRGRLVGALDLERVAAVRGGRGASCAGDRAGAGDSGAEASARRRRDRCGPEVRREHRLLHRHHLLDRLSGRDGRGQSADRPERGADRQLGRDGDDATVLGAQSTGSGGGRSTHSAAIGDGGLGASCSSVCCTPVRPRSVTVAVSVALVAARGDVRPAGRVHRRAVPHPLSLFRRLDRLPGDLDLRRLAGPGDRRSPAAAHAFDDADRRSTWRWPASSAPSPR